MDGWWLAGWVAGWPGGLFAEIDITKGPSVNANGHAIAFVCAANQKKTTITTKMTSITYPAIRRPSLGWTTLVESEHSADSRTAR